MTTQEFEAQLEQLLESAPENAVMLVCYGNRITTKVTHAVQGNVQDLFYDLTLLLAKCPELQTVFELASHASKQPFTKDFAKEYLKSDTHEQ